MKSFLARLTLRIWNPASPAEPAAKTLPMAGQDFVLDGTNIALLHGPVKPELRYVLALTHYLCENGATVCCFFDANTPYRFRDARSEQWSCFEQVITEQPWAETFRLVPSGTEADQWILELAKQQGAAVVSNDRFRDRAKSHRWIWKRRHGVKVIEGKLVLASLSAFIELLPQPEDYLHLLAQLPAKPGAEAEMT